MLDVSSEVGRLRTVLVHEPGPEIDYMVPSMMEELLFDDILFGERAREEHGRFRRLMQVLGIEVLEIRTLATEALRIEEARRWLLDTVADEVSTKVAEALGELEPTALLQSLIAGRRQDVDPASVNLADLYCITPLPNWCFQRDPQVVLGSGVIFSAMATPARWREGLLARCVFAFHPRFTNSPIILDPLQGDADRPLFLGLHRPRLEGGDVLIPSPDVVAVGISERTNEIGVELLARALARREGGPRWLEVVHVPHRRAYMHLDTVFTPADNDAALVYPPVVLGGGSEAADVYEIDLHQSDLEPTHRGALLPTLASRGVDLEPIPCGGADPVAQQREQWTDGANTLALAPGKITLYDRNIATAEELNRHGFEIAAAEDVLLGRTETSLDDRGRVCLLLPSHEISRARGGPHCLSHPLVRDKPT